MGTLYWIAEKSFLPDNSDYLIGVHVISIIVTCADSVSSSIHNSDDSVDDATYQSSSSDAESITDSDTESVHRHAAAKRLLFLFRYTEQSSLLES